MIKVRDALPADFAACAAIAVDSEIGCRYGFEASGLEAKMTSAQAAGAMVFVAENEAGADADSSDREGPAPASPAPRGLLGFAWVDPKGAFGSSPYLKLIAVDSSIRSSGVGAALLAEFERRTADRGRLWTLLVSDFNARAAAFYERHGYRIVGRIPDFAVDGVAEILMVKARP
jgi:ribosomal protein S18 acetylase RimI-like enzyme